MNARILALALFALCAAATAKAEDLIAGLSEHLIRITSNFTGTEIVFFGTIAGGDAFATAEGRDIVVVVRGPDTDVTVRRKEPVLGLWLNRGRSTYTGLPGFYFAVSTRPISQIAAKTVLERQEIGLYNLRFDTVGDTPDDRDAFRAAVIRQRKDERLYGEASGPDAINVIGATLFQVKVPLPADVPVGNYRAEAYLFRNGQIVSAYSDVLFVDKSGVERWLYEKAQDEPLLYGIAVVLLSLGAGWVATVLSNRL